MPVAAARIRAPRPGGLPRERVLALLDRVWDHRLTLVVAPAGSGKTTLLSQFAAATKAPVAWYRAESTTVEAGILLGHLEVAWRAVQPGLPGPWRTVEDAVAALDGLSCDRAVLALDDLHLTRGTPAEAAFERFVEYLPDRVVVIAASRALPEVNLSRLRVSGNLLEIGADDLRFRSWEVERLFREIYGEPLRPEDLAELARRTEGWAAGLQLFHLATRGKPADERRRAVAALAARSRLVREYLARNVLEEMADDVREFVLRASAFGRLHGALCDELLGRSGSDAVLRDLEQGQMFTFALEEEGWFRFHEVLRSHAEAVFVEQVGEERARAHRRRAAALLESAGAFMEALQAYCRSEDWASAARLLRLCGDQLVDGPEQWIDSLPEAMLHHDPWVTLASARRHRAAGRVRAALDAYRQAEAEFGTLPASDTARQERLALSAWADPPGAAPPDWSGILRSAAVRDPMAVARGRATMSQAHAAFVSGVAALFAGRVRDAVAPLAAAMDAEGTTPALGAAARLAAAFCSLLAGEPSAAPLLGAATDDIERLGLLWPAALGRVPLTSSPMPGDAVPWSSGLFGLLSGWRELQSGGDPEPALRRAVSSFAAAGAPVLEAWATSLLALTEARTGQPTAPALAERAERLARATAAPGPWAIALAAVALTQGSGSGGGSVEAEALARECGIAIPGPASAPPAGRHDAPSPALPGPPGVTAAVAPRVAVTCFGGFSIRIGGQPVDLAAAKPRLRSLLRLLAVAAGRPVHREVIIEALWPDVGLEAGTRNLQVAVSALRQVLEPGVARGESSIVGRDGDAYLFVLDEESQVDVVAFHAAIDAATRARSAGRDDDAIAAYRHALALYAGELLPEEGPAEWVLAERERCRLSVVEASFALAEAHAARGELVAAAFACERGLRVDRYRDSLWQLLISLHERSGEAAAAARARQQYAAVLADLGVGPAPG